MSIHRSRIDVESCELEELKQIVAQILQRERLVAIKVSLFEHGEDRNDHIEVINDNQDFREWDD